MLSVTNNISSGIKLEFSSKLLVAFVIEKKGRKIAELDGEIGEGCITVNSMETFDRRRNKLRTILFLSLVEYARENYLKIIAVDNHVSRRLSKNPIKYKDILV